MRPNTAADFWSYVVKGTDTECWTWTATVVASGYGQVSFGGRRWRAHRLAYRLHYGPFDLRLLVCHHCDNRRCCNPAHLFLGTGRDNVHDCVVKGRRGKPAHRYNQGERHPRHKLAAAQVGTIREIYHAKSMTQAQLARAFGVTQGLIAAIVVRRIWRHIA